MPATFSISIGTPTESERRGDIYSVLQNIPDNTQKLISPKDVRDAIFSTWANSVFKQTTAAGTSSNLEYIGIDSNNPSNRDIKQKIFIGKRNVGGVDIMKNSLLSNNINNSDIYIFNTKPDTISQSVTKISILAGTNSSLYDYAPYIKSEYIGATSGDKISMDISNPSLFGGPVNVYSSTGRVAINGIIFPTVAQSTGSSSNGKILRYSGTYPNGSLVWSDDTASLTTIGSPGNPTNIYGSVVNVNGQPLEFSSSEPMPISVGGITQGTTFSDESIVSILDRILYPYVPPDLSLSVINSLTGTKYAEIGTTASLIFTYSITRYSNDIYDAQILGTTFSGITFSSLPGGVLSGTLSGYANSSSSWVLQVDDVNDNIQSFSYSATASIEFINPIYYGFSSTSSLTASSIIGLSKVIKPVPGASQSISINYSGSGYMYFIYTSGSVLNKVIDGNGYSIYDIGSSPSNTSLFVHNDSVTISPGVYNIYKSNYVCGSSGDLFKFIF